MNPVRTRIKICGLTRPQDITDAVNLGADAVGFVFYPPSKRALTLEQAIMLRQQVPAFVSVVALFVNPDPAQVNEVIKKVQPDLLQFHGDETPAQCRQYGRPYIRAFRVGSPGLQTPEQLVKETGAYSDAAAWLFDTYSSGYGGSGHVFNWKLLKTLQAQPFKERRPVILAGGMEASRVNSAINQVRPFAVDVSSGVESAPGIKSSEKMQEFIQAVYATHADLA